ncbi:Sec34-like family-domain-containing protein [Phlyctochytrium arcticum]|nr:Sec34-like family-domain-containing protein [Phlyctochytrium arcticum]
MAAVTAVPTYTALSNINKTAASVEDWDATITLGEAQKRVINLLQDICAQPPPPVELADTDEDKDDAFPVAPVGTTTDLSEIFGLSNPEMEQSQEEGYRAYLSAATAYRNAYDDRLDKVELVSGMLNTLQSNHDSVEGKTSSLQTTSEKLLAEQTHSAEVAEQLSSRLSFFNDLEPIAKLVASPGDDICLDDKFVPMLLRLDECLAFVQAHITFRDAELYLMRFRQCLTRGLTLIKMHFVHTMRSTSTDVREKIANRGNEPLTPNLQLSLFYVKFRTFAPSQRFLLAQLEARCESHPEYFALLGDCLSIYFAVRQNLLAPYIALNVQSLVECGDILTMVRSGCAYVMRLCADEVRLNYLDSLTSRLYDTLRSLILREPRIDTLGNTAEVHAEEDEAIIEEENLGTPSIVNNILEDAQHRLVFRSQRYIREEIEGFTPREEELAILARGRGLPQPMAIQSSYGVISVFSNSNGASNAVILRAESSLEEEDQLEAELAIKDESEPSADVIDKLVFGGVEWYPTMHRTLYILGKLYRCVPTPIFEDLAQDAIQCCRKSLIRASQTISAQHNQLDGQFFLLKNLLMLREHIQQYTGNFIRKEEIINTAQLRETVSGMLQAPWNLGNLGKGLMTAQSRLLLEYSADAKLFMLKVSELRARVPKSLEPLSSKDFGAPEKVISLCNDFTQSCIPHLGLAVGKMSDYLGDRKTELVLNAVIKSNIADAYHAFYNTIASEYDYSVMREIVPVSDISAGVDAICRSRRASTRNNNTPGELVPPSPDSSISPNTPSANAPTDFS